MTTSNAIATCVVLSVLLASNGVSAQQRTQLPAADRILSDKPTVLYTVGAADGEEWELLSGVRAVAFDARDNLYILDGDNFRVLVFDAAGKYVRTISRKGGGPGELMLPSSMTVMADGRIVVTDPVRRGYSLFRGDGTFLSNELWGEEDAAPSGRQSGMVAHPRSGIVAVMIARRVRAERLDAPTGDLKMPVNWADIPAAGGATKTVRLYEFTLPSVTPKVRDAGRGVSVTTLPENWTPESTFGVLPTGGIVTAEEAAYRVKVLSPSGQVERVIERAISPHKGTQKEKDAYIEQQADNFFRSATQQRRTGPGSSGSGTSPRLDRAAIADMLRQAEWRDVIPVLRRVSADPQGRIWIARTPPDFGANGPVDLVRANGTYIGTIPGTMIPGAVSPTGRAAYIERDDLGVEHVTVKRLPAAWQ